MCPEEPKGSAARAPCCAIIDSMAQLIVRNLEDEVVQALKRRAAEHQRSAEEEHRTILRAALLGQPKPDFKDFLMSMPTGDDLDLSRDDSPVREIEI